MCQPGVIMAAADRLLKLRVQVCVLVHVYVPAETGHTMHTHTQANNTGRVVLTEPDRHPHILLLRVTGDDVPGSDVCNSIVPRSCVYLDSRM